MIVVSSIRHAVTGPKKLLSNCSNLRSNGIRKIRYRRNLENGEPDVNQLMKAHNLVQRSNVGAGILKSICFSAGFTVVAFGTSAIYRYEKIQSQRFTKAWAADIWEKFGVPTYNRTHNFFKDLPQQELVFWGIFGVNAVVWLGWRTPSLRRFMVQYFTTSPASKAVCWPLLFSSFSHINALHLMVNMYVLKTFFSDRMSWEQQLALYASGGVVAACASNTIKAARGSMNPSVGASGAIFTLLGYFCVTHPDARLSIIFIPQYNFSAESALKFMIGMDCIGLIAGWKFLDHGCHLGGVLFGILFAHYSLFVVDKQREAIKKWINLKETFSEN